MPGDPIVDLLVTKYGMPPDKAAAFANEVQGGTAVGAKELAGEAMANVGSEHEARMGELKQYADLYKLKASGQQLSPQGEELLARVAAEHKARVQANAERLAQETAHNQDPGVAVERAHMALKDGYFNARRLQDTAKGKAAVAAGDREIGRMDNMATYAKDMRPTGSNRSPWIPQDNFEGLSPNPLVGKPEFDGASVLRALGYGDAAQRVGAATNAPIDPTQPRPIVINRSIAPRMPVGNEAMVYAPPQGNQSLDDYLNELQYLPPSQ